MAGHETRCIIRHSRWKKLTTGSKPRPPPLRSCHRRRAVVQFAFSSRTTFSFRTYFRVRDVVCIMPLCGVFIAHRRISMDSRFSPVVSPARCCALEWKMLLARPNDCRRRKGWLRPDICVAIRVLNYRALLWV